MKKKNNEIDGLLLTACQMLRNPDEYEELPRIVMCLSLEVVYQRIMRIDKEITEAHINEEEYKAVFEDLFSALELTELTDEIKKDYNNIEGMK